MVYAISLYEQSVLDMIIVDFINYNTHQLYINHPPPPAERLYQAHTYSMYIKLYIGQNLKPFTVNGDFSKLVKNS